MGVKWAKRKTLRSVIITIIALLAIVIADKYYSIGYSTARAVVFGVISTLAIVWIPVILTIIVLSVITNLILRKNLDKLEYNMYQLMSKDPEYKFLPDYPDQNKLVEADKKIKQIFNQHSWMKRFDTRIVKEY